MLRTREQVVWDFVQEWMHKAESDLRAASHLLNLDQEDYFASAFHAQQEQIRKLQRLLGKKTLENEILKEALDIATESKKRTLRSLSLPKDGSP